MPQLESTPRAYVEVAPTSAIGVSSIHLRSSNDSNNFDFQFEVIRPNLFRTTFVSESHPLPPWPCVPRPASKSNDQGITCQRPGKQSIKFDIRTVSASVEWADTPIVSLVWNGGSKPLHRDLESRSYICDGHGIAHYTQHDRNALHVGLGEKAAPMDLTGRHFQLSASDCFGYDVYKTDPMYKHLPLLIKATPEGCVAIFSTTHSRGSWSVGSEIDGLWGHFKVYRQDYGGLEEYLITGKTLKDVIRTYAELVGFPLLVPKWAFGYISGGYQYCMGDDPPAYQQLLAFANKLKEHDIPCSAHQMSSGYSISKVEPKVRNVFNWNQHRFPNPEKWIAEYHSRGIRLLTNIKPFVLKSHPDYQHLSDGIGLFRNKDGKTATMRLWSAGGGESGDGSHIDFTSKAAFQWWFRGVQRLKRQGIDAMWNDNNEYVLPNDSWTLALQDPVSNAARPAPNSLGLWGRAMHTELMGKASYDALLSVEPDERPFVLTRSATAGTMRYCGSTWSGDNVTSWASMKGANALSLNAGMSLLQCSGHDIGGFEGPQPSPELLLRWVQLGIYGPRFAINCFKTSAKDNSVGEVIEPWMYPEITPLIRAAIKRRYEILPYIYSLALESHLTASPPQRWVGWGYEADPEVWSRFLKEGEEQFWFGDSLLVGGVFQPGINKARMYLPRKGGEEFDYGYVNVNAPYEYFASGQWVDIASEWKDSIPVVAKIGSAVPIGKALQTLMPGELDSACPTLEKDDYRGIELFPPKGSSYGRVFSFTWFEDDGIDLHPDISSFTIEYSSTEEEITVGLKQGPDNIFQPPWHDLDVILIPGDERHVVSALGDPLEKVFKDDCGRPCWRLTGS